MKIVMSKKKRYLLLLLVLLVLAGATSAIYIFVNSPTSYNVDKYSDPASWCDTNATDKVLHAECKGLLLDITSPEDGSSCFEVQIITKDKELKDITICEKGDTLTYTNEILEYKKLMPIGIVFTYNQKWILNDYSFSNVSFTKLEDTYVQGVVNEDIANLVTIDPSSTTIQNSVDFCPRPETLPDYVTEANKIAYTEYFNKNIMNKEDYTNGYLYNWDDSTIRILFACDSAENMGYTDVCDKTKIQGLDKIASNKIEHLAVTPRWGKESDSEDRALLKEISLIYDSIYLVKQQNSYANLKLFSDLINTINNSNNISEEVFCALEKIYNAIEESEFSFVLDRQFVLGNTKSNFEKIDSELCYSIIRDSIDFQGEKIKQYFTDKGIYENCANLIKLMK